MDIFNPPSLGRGGLNWPGEAGLPRPPRYRAPEKPWNVPPWSTSAPYETERCVMYTLVKTLGFVLGQDFFFQKPIPVPGINKTGRNRSDFWVQAEGKGSSYGVGGWPYVRGRILNPISPYTHRSVGKDRFERTLIRLIGKIDVVYIRDVYLFAAPKDAVEEALRGVDKSGR